MLYCQAARGNTEVVQLLVESQANVNAQNKVTSLLARYLLRNTEDVVHCCSIVFAISALCVQLINHVPRFTFRVCARLGIQRSHWLVIKAMPT